MVFSSVSFLVFFLPALLAGYYLVPQRLRGLRNLVLLTGSVVFYAWGGLQGLALLAVSIVVYYLCGLLAAGKNTGRLAAALAAVFGVGMLVIFKYLGFFARTAADLGLEVSVPSIALPIGISFYTFQGLSYVIDVYRDGG